MNLYPFTLSAYLNGRATFIHNARIHPFRSRNDLLIIQISILVCLFGTPVTPWLLYPRRKNSCIHVGWTPVAAWTQWRKEISLALKRPTRCNLLYNRSYYKLEMKSYRHVVRYFRHTHKRSVAQPVVQSAVSNL
jgi:hypothetical protein